MVRIPVIRNRRRFSRRTVHSAVLVSMNGGRGLLYNLSESGLAVDVMGPPPPSQLISLAFKLPGAGEPIEASAQLAWKEEPGRRAGLRFRELPQTAQQRIKEWLSSRAVGLDEQEADRAQSETLTPGPVEVFTPQPETSGAISQVNEAALPEPAADSAASTPSQAQPEALRSQGFASWEVNGWKRDNKIPQANEATFPEPAADSAASTPSQAQPEGLRSQGFASWEVDGWERDNTIPQVNEAAFPEPAADSTASTPSQAQPEALRSRGFASWEAEGWQPDHTIVGELRRALLRAEGREVPELEPSQPPSPEQLARRRHMSNLIFAVVGGSLLGVALGMGIVLLDAYNPQVFAGLNNVKRSVVGLFTPAKKSIPPNAPPQADANKPVGDRDNVKKPQ